MGGFFLSHSEPAALAAEAFFRDLELPYKKHKLRSHWLILLQKKFIRCHENLFESEHGCIAGVGTWLSENAFGPAALPMLLEAAAQERHEFSKLTGHAAFIVETANGLRIFTDRIGMFPVYCGTDSRGQHYSSSVLALASALDRLELNRQAIREFLNVETVLGRETIFQNIEPMRGGHAIRVDTGMPSEERYYNPADSHVSIQDLPGLLVRQLTRLKTAGLGAGDICCDLSGGYDSRTVAALLHTAGVPHTLNTNTNPLDPGDHEAAVRAATALHRPIVLYSYAPGPDARTANDYVFPRLDLARNVPRSLRTLLMFEGKAERHALLLGGYGGELLRDVYSRPKNLDEVIKAFFCRGLRLEEREQREYVDRLHTKFSTSLAELGFAPDDRPSERIYFFEKMRAWGGTRIGVYNRYAYGWHPLLDHQVQQYLFTIPIDAKADAQLQRQVIAVDKALAQQPYTNSEKQRPRKGPKYLLKHFPAAARAYKATRQLASTYARTSHVSHVQDIPGLTEFQEASGTSLEQCVGEDHRGRFLTLVEAFLRYRSKLAT